MNASLFPDLVREAIASIEAQYAPILEKAQQAVDEYNHTQAQVQSDTVSHAVTVFDASPYAREELLKKVRQLPELEALARAGEEAIRQLRQERIVIAPIQIRLRGFVTGLKVLREAEAEIAGMRARGELVESFRTDIVATSKASLLRSIEDMVSMLKDLGWKPTAAQNGTIGAAKKALGGVAMRKAA